jgi:LemA protein
MLVVAIFAGAVIVGVFLTMTIFNRLVELRNRLANAFAQIYVQLRRRYDLIPNLVETAKGYLAHERATLDDVMQARAGAMQAERRAAQNPAQPGVLAGLAGAEQALNGALGRLLVTVEAYPDLKANETMAQLMEELTTTENKVAFARQAYNDAVMGYNTARERFPNVLVAGPFGFQPAALYELDRPEALEAPRVSLA